MDMKGVEEDLREAAANPGDEFDGLIDQSKMTSANNTNDEEREIWFDDVNDASIFYGADFSPLADFPCMSSSSSSSSTPAPVKPVVACSSYTSTASSNSSSAASWAVLKHEDSNNHNNNQGEDLVDGTPAAALSSTASMEIPQSDQNVMYGDCMDVMESFGYIDHLLDDNNDFFDPCSIFHHVDIVGLEEDHNHQFQQDQKPQLQQLEQEQELQVPMISSSEEQLGSDDLATVFLEWLKNNKESVSAEDLRRVKIKKATIECAAKRLGGGKEAMKQLLKLILEWVQTNHLQKRRNNINIKESNPNPNLIDCNSGIPPISEPNSCFSQPTWIHQQPPYHPTDPAVVPGFIPVVNGYPYQAPTDSYGMLDSAQTRPASQFALAANSHYNSFAAPVPDNNNNLHPSAFPPGYNGNNQYPYQYQVLNDQRLGSSATKEARKKRMARQRRFAPHHRNHNQHNNNNNQQQISQHQDQTALDQHARLVNEQCVATAQPNPGNWIYWPPISASCAVATNPHPVLPAPAEVAMMHHPVNRPPMQGMTYQARQLPSDKRQGWKTEKNLRFLLQKVLKQSDVGNLGRIVLPKKEAEIHLPGLEARDGISIDMEDIGTSRVWNMRYRFWPNNKSRMYLLENTGDFVRTNGLQEGDFIVIYSDVKCGKYLIRGVKVPQSGPKSETKRPAKTQKNQHATSPAAAAATINGFSSSPIKKNSKVKSEKVK